MRISDWSSDVCSSVLGISSAVICRSRDAPLDQQRKAPVRRWKSAPDDVARTPDLHRRAVALGRDRARSLAGVGDRKSVVAGKRGVVRVDLRGRCFMYKNNNKTREKLYTTQNEL